MNSSEKKAQWIGTGNCCVSWQSNVLPAPYFRRTFEENNAQNAKVMICGLGYYELYLNGRKVGNHVLDPVVTQYDKRVRFVTYDVSEYLRSGRNVIGVILGNGWYNCHTPEVWNFDKAAWRDYPKLHLRLTVDDQTILVSDTNWKWSSGPIVFDGLRNGETYDARLELGNWLSPDYDDADWKSCRQVNPPGGIMDEQIMPACQVMSNIPPVKAQQIEQSTVYDFGQNISGWCRIFLAGECGAEVRIVYGERLDSSGNVDQSHITKHVLVPSGQFQTDRYILKGGGALEEWEPRFTYHGFQYAQVFIDGRAEIRQIEARFVYTAFSEIGEFKCSDELLNKLQDCTLRSYKGNFVGIPTDCPHREKNGWTGDAHLASETGLWNFDAASSYAQWIDGFADVQRPNGQLPAIVPSAGWGFNWGSGPAWDSAFLIIPWNIYLYTGDSSTIVKHYDAMKRYVGFCSDMANDHIVSFGLGDWNAVDQQRSPDPALTSTGYYYTIVKLMIKFAELTDRPRDRNYFFELASEIRNAFNRRFYHGDGVYGKGEHTALASALYHGLAEDAERPLVIKRLVSTVKANGCKVDFGILGAKYVPRVLADNGYADLAFRLILQPEYPGWVNWLKQGATTLWGNWNGGGSRNHIMFGDISAWMYQYLAGIAPDHACPGFKHFTVTPDPVDGLSKVSASHSSRYGLINVEWTRDCMNFRLKLQVPPETSATVVLPDKSILSAEPGMHEYEVKMINR